MRAVVAPDKVIDPYRLEVLADRAHSTEADIDAAIDAAHHCFREGRNVPGAQRAAWLTEAADRVEEAKGELAMTLARTIGKPVRAAEFEIARAAAVLRLSAGEIVHLRGETLKPDAVTGGAGIVSSTSYEPYGVAALVTPFNAPINLLAQKLGPAIAAGNTVLIKPAPEGALVTDQFVDIVSRVLPAGWCTVVHGGAQETLRLVSDARVRVVSCTGGVVAGESILAGAGIKPVWLELGSNSPNIVLDDADIDVAARQIARAAFEASGQQCISAQRILVQRGVAAEFLDALVQAASQLVLGDPLESTTDLGPLVSARAAERVADLVQDAVGRGASIALDGRPADGESALMFGPTIVTDVPADARLLAEEVFGPVAVVLEVASLEEAVEVANDVPGLLQASCFTNNLAHAYYFAHEVEAGSVWVNEATRFRLDIHPFGGTGTSGVGREGISYAIREFCQLKHLGIRLGRP